MCCDNQYVCDHGRDQHQVLPTCTVRRPKSTFGESISTTIAQAIYETIFTTLQSAVCKAIVTSIPITL